MTTDRRKFLRTTAIVAAISGFTTSHGEIIIECELSGQQKDYILTTKKYLEGLISS